MAKRIKFPLEMDNGVHVRTLDELKANFSMVKVLEYYENGKLAIWLKDRYEDSLAERVNALSQEDNLVKGICEIFAMPYDEETEKSLDELAEKKQRLAKLMEYTTDQEIIANIDFVVFNQEELTHLLAKNPATVYLCGKSFTLPLEQHGIKYVGINNPILIVESDEEVDWLTKEITLEGISYDDNYQAIVDAAAEARKKSFTLGDYTNNSMVNNELSDEGKTKAMNLFELSRPLVELITYNPELDMARKMELGLSKLPIEVYDSELDIVVKKELALSKLPIEVYNYDLNIQKKKELINNNLNFAIYNPEFDIAYKKQLANRIIGLL